MADFRRLCLALMCLSLSLGIATAQTANANTAGPATRVATPAVTVPAPTAIPADAQPLAQIFVAPGFVTSHISVLNTGTPANPELILTVRIVRGVATSNPALAVPMGATPTPVVPTAVGPRAPIPTAITGATGFVSPPIPAPRSKSEQ